jgi:inorganic pyrophosphatase
MAGEGGETSQKVEGKTMPGFLHASLDHIPAFDPETGLMNVIVETPRGHRNKYKYDRKLQAIKLDTVMPAGVVFPFNFGFIPSTLAEDEDPLDVLIFMDEAAFPGCVVAARLLGVIQAEQTEPDSEPVRNDRLIAVADESYEHKGVDHIEQIHNNLMREIEHFFVSYNQISGVEFKLNGTFGPDQARPIVERGIERFQKQRDAD